MDKGVREVVVADRIQYFFEVGGGAGGGEPGGGESGEGEAPKGPNVQPLTVLTFNAHEEISRLSRFQLTLWSEDPALNIKDMIRQPAKIRIEWDKRKPKVKTFNGIVASIRQTNAGRAGEVDKLYGHYSCEVVPELWLLGQKSNCKIFQEMPAQDIIAEVLDARGMAGKFDMQAGGCRVREFCLQYRETDLAFISRLMEEEGLYYWFDYEKDGLMVISNNVGSYGKCWPEEVGIYKKGAGVLSTPDERPDLEFLHDLVYEENAHTGKVAYRDWDYRAPEKPPMRPEAAAEDHTDLEIYDYHLERYLDPPGEGAHYAQMAVEAQSALRKTLSGSGTFRSITCGAVLTIEEAYRNDLNGKWVIVSLSHNATQTGSTGVDYSVSFTAIPAETTFRPLPRTPQPAVTMQTATVVGPEGAEWYMDEYGRAKVQFHWDLDHDYGPDASCWIRVSQHYAGMLEDGGIKHGFQWHPLIDDEVIVDFLEGDPDNPVIIGSVYNYVKTPIVKPDEMIRNRILTRYQHQLLFDDKEQAITLNTPYPHTLKMDDPAKKITLDTRYKHQLEMWDPHDDNSEIPNVQLKTGGDEVIRMEDKDDEYGNNIKISTVDGHFEHLLEGESEKGIIVQTRDGHFVKLKTDFEGEKGIEIQTSKNHRVWMDDVNRTIVVTSKDKHRIEVNDKEEFIEVADASRQQRFHINIKRDKITIENKTGDIDILAPKGKVKIDAESVDVIAKTSVKVDCNNMSTKATTHVKTKAAQIEE
ncbi:MAG: type VI secretion system tip protein TssI/VgrG, partial [Acidobacteriota bacterium]